MLWTEVESISRAVAAYAAELHARPEVAEVIWYGSWVSGTAGPRSDVDLCVIVSEADVPRRHRAAQYLPVGFPTGVDLVVFTQSEWASLPKVAPKWHAAIAEGRRM